MNEKELKDYLNELVARFNQKSFIDNDPISIPHRFTKKQDIEIMGFWTAILSWGQRVTILNKSNELITLMDGAPYDFIKNHSESDLKIFTSFKHRTFNLTDTLYFIHFFKHYYMKYGSLEDAFSSHITEESENVKGAIEGFHRSFFDLEDSPSRTKKHVSTPSKNSSCKRINMFLRWMVRSDVQGVDFGLWKKIKPSQLICPCDVHVERVARRLHLIEGDIKGWKMATNLTNELKKYDSNDPVKYDFALFGLGVEETHRYTIL